MLCGCGWIEIFVGRADLFKEIGESGFVKEEMHILFPFGKKDRWSSCVSPNPNTKTATHRRPERPHLGGRVRGLQHIAGDEEPNGSEEGSAEDEGVEGLDGRLLVCVCGCELREGDRGKWTGYIHSIGRESGGGYASIAASPACIHPLPIDPPKPNAHPHKT